MIYADTVGRREGTRTHAAMLNDPRLLPQMRKQLQRAKSQPKPRPELEGFTRDVHELHNLNVTLTQVLRALTRNYNIDLPVGPRYPSEVIQAEDDAAELEDLYRDVKFSTKRARQAMKDGGDGVGG